MLRTYRFEFDTETAAWKKCPSNVYSCRVFKQGDKWVLEYQL